MDEARKFAADAAISSAHLDRINTWINDAYRAEVLIYDGGRTKFEPGIR